MKAKLTKNKTTCGQSSLNLISERKNILIKPIEFKLNWTNNYLEDFTVASNSTLTKRKSNRLGLNISGDNKWKCESSLGNSQLLKNSLTKTLKEHTLNFQNNKITHFMYIKPLTVRNDYNFIRAH